MASKAGGGIQKKQWGAVKPSNAIPNVAKDVAAAAAGGDAAPRFQRASPASGGGFAIKLTDLDTNKLEIGPVLKDGMIGDKFMEVRYEGKMLKLRFDDMGQYRIWPFQAGPAVSKDGTKYNDKWGGAVELSGEEYDLYRGFEAAIVERLKPRFEELMAHAQKKGRDGKPLESYTQHKFTNVDFNSQVEPANVEKGYPPKFRVGVQHEAVGAMDGKPRTMPKIWLTKLMGENTWTKPRPGTIDDLTKKCAVNAVFRVFRGVYFGQSGWGMRFTLDEAYIFTNKSADSQSSIDTSMMKIVPDPDEENEPKPPLEENIVSIDDAALATFDNGTGNGGY